MATDSDDDNVQLAYIPFSDRPNWSDVTPLPQNDGPDPVVPIMYTKEFEETMGYFRAILQKDERSERAFQLTADVISLNAANYTAWHFRRLLLKDLNKNLRKELVYTEELANQSPKNYQIWYHRRAVVQLLNDPSKELEFSANILEDDSKNYHAWTHRHWVVESFGLWEKELAYVDSLLSADIRNNSAWNYRHFLVSKTSGFTIEVIKEELDYAFKCIKKAPNNESAWNYLKGVIHGKRYSDFPQIKAFCIELSSSGILYPHSLALQIELFEEDAEIQKNESAIEEAIKICDLLGTRIDTIRQKYWSYRKAILQQRKRQ